MLFFGSLAVFLVLREVLSRGGTEGWSEGIGRRVLLVLSRP